MLAGPLVHAAFFIVAAHVQTERFFRSPILPMENHLWPQPYSSSDNSFLNERAKKEFLELIAKLVAKTHAEAFVRKRQADDSAPKKKIGFTEALIAKS